MMVNIEHPTDEQIRVALIALAKETPSEPTTPEADRLKRDLEAVSAYLASSRKVLRDHEITDLEDGGRVYVDALALAELRDAVRKIGGR